MSRWGYFASDTSLRLSSLIAYSNQGNSILVILSILKGPKLLPTLPPPLLLPLLPYLLPFFFMNNPISTTPSSNLYRFLLDNHRLKIHFSR